MMCARTKFALRMLCIEFHECIGDKRRKYISAVWRREGGSSAEISEQGIENDAARVLCGNGSKKWCEWAYKNKYLWSYKKKWRKVVIL